MYGYAGKLLFIDLSTGKITVEDLDAGMARNYLGGPALGARILYDRMPAHCGVFSGQSMVGFVTGPLNDTGSLFGGRYTVVSKSPVTGGWNDANAGGYFGPALKKAGYDAVFVSGISERPVYILIDNGEASILDAEDIWGKTVSETESYLREKHGEKTRAALIGPAGENLSFMAAVMNDGHRAAGRGGTGAVLGSKKLKAIAVKGERTTEVFDRPGLVALNKEIAEWMKGPGAGMAGAYGPFGSGVAFVGSVLSGDAGVKNWTGSGVADYPEAVAAPVGSLGLEPFKTGKYHCSNCPLGCGAYLSIPSDKWDLSHSARPEYETQGAFGSLCLCTDPAAVCRCNDLCNEYGLDTISAGSTVAWAMECCDRGILSREELDGIDLSWGNGDAMTALVEKMGRGEGVGSVLAKGSREAARIFAKGGECLVTASGIEEPQHDSRLAFGLARTYQFDPTPGRHVKGGYGFAPCAPDFDYETGEADKKGVINTEIVNASGHCLFGDMLTPPGNILKACSAVTGFTWDGDEAEKLGLRMFTMRHAFNLREGLRREDFTLSARYRQSRPPFTGPLAGVQVDTERLADNFFEAMDWDRETLVPSRESLEAIGGLDDVIGDLYGAV